jgi:hypothetical protein
MFSKMELYTSSLCTLSTSPKIRVFFKNVWLMSLSPNQEFITKLFAMPAVHCQISNADTLKRRKKRSA